MTTFYKCHNLIFFELCGGITLISESEVDFTFAISWFKSVDLRKYIHTDVICPNIILEATVVASHNQNLMSAKLGY